MKRNSFIQTIAAVSAALIAPINSIAGTVRAFREKKGFYVAAGKDRHDKAISLFEGDVFSTKVSTEDSAGDIYMFESVRVKQGGPSHHYHFDQDEWWYVLQGQFLIKVGEETYQAKAGDSVFGPRMVPHSFAKVGEGEGKLLMFFQPAGKMEEFFMKVSVGATTGMTEEQQEKFREDHGFKKVGPALTEFKKW